PAASGGKRADPAAARPFAASRLEEKASMSASDEGKPAQTGLVDMGQNHFYDNPADYPPPFLTSDLGNYPRSFSQMVLNVAWQQLQPTKDGALDTSVIDGAIHRLDGTGVGIKLRVWGGYQAPDWAKAIDGPPITITGVASVDTHFSDPRTIGRWWTGDYI